MGPCNAEIFDRIQIFIIIFYLIFYLIFNIITADVQSECASACIILPQISAMCILFFVSHFSTTGDKKNHSDSVSNFQARFLCPE